MRYRTLRFQITSFVFYFFSLAYCYSQSSEKPFVYGDMLPDAPELAERGAYQVGVQTLELINENQIDILNYSKGTDTLYHRPLTIEVWYPAEANPESGALLAYEEVMGNANTPGRPIIPFTFFGRATRDAKARYNDAPISPDHCFARLYRLTLFNDLPYREPGIEGLCGCCHCSHGIHIQ
jgi:hypothetical protein